MTHAASRNNRRGLWQRLCWSAVALAGWISPAGNAATVYLEDSPAAQELVDEAARLEEEGRLGDAAQKLQQVVDDYPNKLMPQGDDRYTDAILWVRDRLRHDPALLEAYRNRFEPVAERALAMAADSGQAADQLTEVSSRYALTLTGLKASLQLAGYYVERADTAGAESALRGLETHPDLPVLAREYHAIAAWAAALSDDPDQVARQLEALRVLGAAGQADSLAHTLEDLTPPADRAAASLAAGNGDEPPLVRPLWQVTIESEESAADNRLRPRLVNQRGLPENVSFKPVAVADMLLLNDSERVYALDRTSGRLRWVYRYQPPDAEGGQANNGLSAFGRVIVDDRQVLVVNDRVYAVMGYMAPWQGRRATKAPPTELVCLDLDTGDMHWSVSPEQLDDTVDRASFHGTPVAVDGQVVTMARRSQVSSFQDSYLISVSADDGTLRWRRHFSSTSVPNNRGGPAALSQITLEGDRIYFCDNLGAAAAVDARSGTVRWIRVLGGSDPEAAAQQNSPIPFAVASGPTLCPAGLLVPLSIDDGGGIVLDPDSGRTRLDIDASSPIASAFQVLTHDGDLLVIGRGVSRLDGQSLATIWKHTPDDDPRKGSLDQTAALRGNALIVAVPPGRFEEIDLDSGQLIRGHETPWTGNLLALGNAWVVTADRRVGSYMAWDDAFKQLQQRATETPDDPETGLNMAILAINAGQPEAVSSGVDLALTALSMNASNLEDDPEGYRLLRQRVFNELLTLTQRHDAVDATVIEHLFDQLATTTETPAELVAYHLTRGEFLEAVGRPADAVEAYQSVLLDPRLAAEPYTRNGQVRRGDISAQQHLFSLIDKHGSDAYERFERQAQRELTQLRLNPQATADDLLSLPQRYPLASAAAEALFAAAELQSQTTTHQAAVTQYRRAFQLADNDDLRARAAGALAAYYSQHDQPDAAARWLALVARNHPDLQPIREGVPADPAAWIAQLRQTQSPLPARPPLGLAWGEPAVLRGRPIPVTDHDGVPSSRNHLILRVGNELSLYHLPDLQPQWTYRLDSGEPDQVHLSSDNLLLYAARAGQLIGLDTRTGEPLWPAINIEELLNEVGDRYNLADARRSAAGEVIHIIQGDVGMVRPAEAVAEIANQAEQRYVVAGEAVVCIVDGHGRAAGVDRYTGRPLWHYAIPMDVAEQARVVDDVLVVAGLSSPNTDAQSARVALIDIATGRPRFSPLEEREPIESLDLTPEGNLLLVYSNHVALHDRADGTLRWRVELPAAATAGKPEVYIDGGHLFVVEDITLIAIDTHTGTITGTGTLITPRSVNTAADGKLLVIENDYAAAFGPDAQLTWRDAIHLEPKRLITQRIATDVALLVAHPDDPNVLGLNLFALDLKTGRILKQLTLPPGISQIPPATVRLLDHHIVLAGRTRTVIIPDLSP